MKNRLLHVFLLCMAVLLVHCKTRNYGDDAESGSDVLATKKSDLEKVSWSCASVPSGTNGNNTQEEYCEWSIRKREPGKGLQCDIVTNFDKSRPLYMTSGVHRGRPITRFNSDFQLKNIYAKCKANPNVGCGTSYCVSYRNSDPKICKTISTAVKKGCDITPVFEDAVVYDKSKTGDLKKPLVAIRLEEIPTAHKKYCFYKFQKAGEKEFAIAGVDPEKEKTSVRCYYPPGEMTSYTNCDKVADDFNATIRFKVGGSSCSLQ